jgi:hypothetical protein
MRPYFKKPFTKIGLVECLKMKTLSLSPSIAKKKKFKTFDVNLHINNDENLRNMKVP